MYYYLLFDLEIHQYLTADSSIVCSFSKPQRHKRTLFSEMPTTTLLDMYGLVGNRQQQGGQKNLSSMTDRFSAPWQAYFCAL